MIYAVLGDLHRPFHDQRAIDLFIYICKDIGVTHLIINGDLIDFININAHGAKSPDLHVTLDDELNDTRIFLEDLRNQLPKVKIIYNYGNHCYRLDRFIMNKCPSFWNIVKLEKQLGLDRLEIEHHPYNERYQIEKTNCFVQHSPPSYSKNAASVSLDKKIDQDSIYGCTHRPDFAVRPSSSGRLYQAHCLGWFGTTGYYDQIKKVSNDAHKAYSWTKGHESWACSFALVATNGRDHHIQHILMKDYACFIGGEYYYG